VAYKQKVKRETEGVEDPSALTPAELDYMVIVLSIVYHNSVSTRYNTVYSKVY
jgi:hypothetical protein